MDPSSCILEISRPTKKLKSNGKLSTKRYVRSHGLENLISSNPEAQKQDIDSSILAEGFDNTPNG